MIAIKYYTRVYLYKGKYTKINDIDELPEGNFPINRFKNNQPIILGRYQTNG